MRGRRICHTLPVMSVKSFPILTRLQTFDTAHLVGASFGGGSRRRRRRSADAAARIKLSSSAATLSWPIGPCGGAHSTTTWPVPNGRDERPRTPSPCNDRILGPAQLREHSGEEIRGNSCRKCCSFGAISCHIRPPGQSRRHGCTATMIASHVRVMDRGINCWPPHVR